MTDELEGEVTQLQTLLTDILCPSFTPKITKWAHGITISFSSKGLVELSIGFDDDNPNWYGYNPFIITKATVIKVESAILEWMKNIKTGVWSPSCYFS
jgi:hypothetical protein